MAMDIGTKVKQKPVKGSKAEDLLSRSVGKELHHLDHDRLIKTDESENKRRRTVELSGCGGSWGFTLQTYGIRNNHTDQIDIMTYVDYVEFGSSAWHAGVRKGDVILAVNGESVEQMTHHELVSTIHKCQHTMRLVVLFEDCCRKVELHERYLRLKALLKGKQRELKALEEREWCVSQGVSYLDRSEPCRASILSSTTCSSTYSWDEFSCHQSFDESRDNGSKENLYIDSDDYTVDSVSASAIAERDPISNRVTIGDEEVTAKIVRSVSVRLSADSDQLDGALRSTKSSSSNRLYEDLENVSKSQPDSSTELVQRIQHTCTDDFSLKQTYRSSDDDKNSIDLNAIGVKASGDNLGNDGRLEASHIKDDDSLKIHRNSVHLGEIRLNMFQSCKRRRKGCTIDCAKYEEGITGKIVSTYDVNREICDDGNINEGIFGKNLKYLNVEDEITEHIHTDTYVNDENVDTYM